MADLKRTNARRRSFDAIRRFIFYGVKVRPQQDRTAGQQDSRTAGQQDSRTGQQDRTGQDKTTKGEYEIYQFF